MPTFRFKPSVRFAERHQALVVLDTGSPGPSLKLAREAAPLLEALHRGTDQVGGRGERACVRELQRYGFIEDSSMDPAIAARARAGVAYLANPDPAARVVASMPRHVPDWLLTSIVALMLIASAIAGGAMLWQWLDHRLPFQFSWIGVAVYLLLIMPLHEFSHAVACRYAGMPVSGIGVQYRRRLIPTLFTNTKGMVLVGSPKLRTLVPLAGPMFELMLVGALSGFVLAADAPGTTVAIASTIAAMTVYFFVFNLNPFRPSDGSNALSEWLTSADGSVAASHRKAIAVAKTIYIVLFVLLMMATLDAIIAPIVADPPSWLR